MNLSKNLLFFLPFALVTGPLLSEIIIIFISIDFIYNSFKKKLWSYYKNTFSIFFYIIYFIFLFSSLISDFKLFSLSTSVPYIRYLFFILGVVYLLKKYEDEDISYNFFKYLSLSLFLVALSGYLEFFFNFNPLLAEQRVVMHRVSGLFGDELILGSYLARLLPLSLICYYINIKKINKVLYLFFLLFIFGSVVTSGERTALLFCLCSILTFSLFGSKKIINNILVLTSFILFFLILINFNPILKNRIFIETKNQIFRTESNNINLFSKEHSSHYQSAYKMFTKKPFSGHGPKNFRHVCKQKVYYKNLHSCSTHPHNFYLQLAAETGFVLPVFFFIIFFISCAIYIKNLFKRNFRNLTYFLPVIVFLFPFAPNGSFFNNWLSIISFLSLVLTINFIFFKKIND